MKRIAAIVLPRIACEMAERQLGLGHDESLGVIVDTNEGAGEAADGPVATAVLDAVNERALRYGARPGQRVSEAAAFVGRLRTAHVTQAELRRELGKVAELALMHGTTAAIELGRESPKDQGPSKQPQRLTQPRSTYGSYPGGAGAGPEDTVWLDVSGCARLTGGEDWLCEQLRERVAVLGHSVRVTIADGPRIAQAVARWGTRQTVVEAGGGATALDALPIAALTSSSEVRGFFGKLGILRIADLRTIDRAGLASRLGTQATDLLDLLDGRDERPLLPYTPCPTIDERASFEHEIEGTEPLLFVLRGLVARAAARLAARGQSARRLVIGLEYDRAFARLAGLSEPALRLVVDPPLPLSSAEELTRAVRAKLEGSQLGAPVIAVELTLAELGARAAAQLDLSRAAQADPRALPALLAELGASLGAGRIGVLGMTNSHRPEAQSALRAVALDDAGPPRSTHGVLDPPVGKRATAPWPWWWLPSPTRLLPRPLLIGPIKSGALVTLDRHIYVVDRIRFDMRFDRVQWWTAEPLSRDYARIWLHTAAQASSEQVHAEAWVYLEPGGEQGFLHGWFD